MKIYWAGPLFSAAEREWNVRITERLKSFGHEVWVPQEIEPRDKTAFSIFAKDVQGIDWADVVVAVMDGADPDSGTCWECGYAYKAGKPIITVRTDFRNSGDIGDARFNLMLHASATNRIYVAFQDTTYIAISIEKSLKALPTKIN